ncbi:hypothetical protein KC19_11G081800 [Ceratodon purpureus]|uniref:Uncharacterized protein n=1 Tax=Ceratodon purpureus TaxID=3225 RepID=A0A8T0GET7_CERPU|nr:hypothetical protein KC19_11G081800 [Ceratodon purpureus]
MTRVFMFLLVGKHIDETYTRASTTLFIAKDRKDPQRRCNCWQSICNRFVPSSLLYKAHHLSAVISILSQCTIIDMFCTRLEVLSRSICVLLASDAVIPHSETRFSVSLQFHL